MNLILGLMVFYMVLGRRKQTAEDKQANEYFPVLSSSEIVAGHPIVGVA
jgi:hypothetical protein